MHEERHFESNGCESIADSDTILAYFEARNAKRLCCSIVEGWPFLHDANASYMRTDQGGFKSLSLVGLELTPG